MAAQIRGRLDTGPLRPLPAGTGWGRGDSPCVCPGAVLCFLLCILSLRWVLTPAWSLSLGVMSTQHL